MNRESVVSRLQGEAWEAWNASYHEPDADAFRALSEALYWLDIRDRIDHLFATLDQQNQQVEAVLSSSR
ncbi:MAG: hypothetical protein ACRDFS_00585 [Chloroflexota bacterium]